MASVLLVDDQPDIRMTICLALERDGHEVIQAGDGPEALARFEDSGPVELVMLDIGLPGGSGLDVLTNLRQRSDVPVILVTSRSDEPDRIVGLRMGADDYVVKPFSLQELMARVAAVLRRCGPPALAAPGSSDEPVTVGPLTIHRRHRRVELRGCPVNLTHREFELLDHLATRPLVVFGRDELLRDIWHSKSEWQDPATVTEHVRRLRLKLEDDPTAPQLIQTVRSAGYRFVPPTAIPPTRASALRGIA